MKIKSILMGILAAGLCLSACSPLQVAVSSYDASTQPTATPGEKITDIPQIVGVLNQLAEKNVSMYEMEGWWRRNNTVVSQSGDLHSSDHEEWSHLPPTQSECMAKMDISKDASTGEVVLMQMQLPEGYLGDLISLRQGTSEVMKVDLALCRLTAEATEAGYLAQSLQGSASSKDSRRNLEFANAWYEEQNGKQVFVVYAGFKTPFEKLISQTEAYSFDLQSGMVIDHFLSMGWQDGSEMGNFETQSRYELWEKLPEDIAAQYNQASEELKTYVGKPINTPSDDITPEPTPELTPEPTAQPIDLESIIKPYTEKQPLTDETQAVALVQEIMRRRTAWISQPGWLLQKDTWLGGKDYTHEQYILVHITGDKGECQEQMVYFLKDGAISPWIIRLADGTSGNLYALEKSKGAERSDIKENTLCSLTNGESIFIEGDFLLRDETDILEKFVQDTKNGLIKGDFKIWMDEFDSRPVIVLDYRTENDPINGPVVMNPSTQELEHFSQSDDLRYFDLDTGMLVWLAGRYSLEDVVIDDGSGGTEYTWQFFTELPDEIAQAYTQAAEELESYISK